MDLSSKPRHRSVWVSSGPGLGSKRKCSASEEEDTSGCSDEELELAIISRYKHKH